MPSSRSSPPDPGAPGAQESPRLDFRNIREALRAGKGTPAWLASWLPSTYANPDGFRDALYAFAAARPEGATRSRPRTSLDFYHDCVLAHVGRHRTAVIAKEGRERVRISFDALHVRCSALAASWAAEGVLPGQTVALVLPPGVPFVVALLTGLRMGLVVSVVPPLGSTWVRTRVDAVAPDRVVADGLGARMAGAAPDKLLPLKGSTSSIAGVVHHRYEPAAVAARLVSPLLEAGAVPFEVTADALHGALVRDAMIAYALDATDVLAAPGFSPAQHQPQLLLTTLLAGACYVELDDNELDAEPKLLEELGVTVLGVRPALRERLLDAQGNVALPSRRAWFRSLSDTLDNERWDELARTLAAQKLLGFEVFSSGAVGGVQLFGAPSASPALRVWPAAGERWQLSEIAGGLVPALGPSGVYTPLRDDEAVPAMPGIVLAEMKDGYLFVGPQEQMSGGLSYPAEEVARVVERHPDVESAAIILAPGRWLNDARTVLLVFVRDASPDTQPPVHELRASIAREMGAALLPDRVETYPLRPRFVEGVVDRAWCRSEYLSGGLNRRARSELFVALSRLGWIFGAAVDTP